MYICIIFSICMCGLMSAMDAQANAIIGINPRMDYRPLIEGEALIWYDSKNGTQIKKYVDNINEFLAPYTNSSLFYNKGENQYQCGGEKPPKQQVCVFDVRLLGPCTKENDYGYANKTPCIIIKLNEILNWEPVYYDDPSDLPEGLPSDIKQYISSIETAQHRRKVWVSCSGERAADQEALGPLLYWPYPGLPDPFFPYVNTPGYQSPIVAVQLLKPSLHQIINIRCRAWAKDIVYTENSKERLGSAHLEIMID